MRCSALLFTLAILGVLPGIARGVSGIGSGVKSSVSLFETSVPPYFFIQPLPTDRVVRARSNFGFGSRNGGTVVAVDYREFFDEFPELVGQSREKVEEYFLSREWTRSSLDDPCVVYFEKDTEDGHFAIATWGDGFGLVIFGPPSSLVASAIDYSIERLVLLEGACRWSN